MVSEVHRGHDIDERRIEACFQDSWTSVADLLKVMRLRYTYFSIKYGDWGRIG